MDRWKTKQLLSPRNWKSQNKGTHSSSSLRPRRLGVPWRRMRGVHTEKLEKPEAEIYR